MTGLDNVGRERERNENGQYMPMPEGESRLTQAQLLAIEYLAQGMKGASVARKLGLVPGTLYRWFGMPEFVAASREANAAALQAAVPDALNLLHKQVNSTKLNPFARQNAARDLLDRAGVGRDRDGQATQIIVEVSSVMPVLGEAADEVVETEGEVR